MHSTFGVDGLNYIMDNQPYDSGQGIRYVPVLFKVVVCTWFMIYQILLYRDLCETGF